MADLSKMTKPGPRPITHPEHGLADGRTARLRV